MPQNRLAHQVVADRYELLDTVGRGGFGVVWRACDNLLQRHVAVKEITIPAFLNDEERAGLREKVLKEARAAARLDHPNAVTVFDVIDDDGHPVIVMELVEAPNLSELVSRRGPLEPAEAARIGLEILDVLEAAHTHGIVHRDVKPGNVMVSDSGRVRLGDFGVAAILDDPTVTTSGAITGSPAYMAPEQATNKGAVAASDLWSLGATLYFSVEGRPPFDKGAPLPTLTSIVQDPPRPHTQAGALGSVLDGLLVKDPAGRLAGPQLRAQLERVSAPPAPALADTVRPDDTVKSDDTRVIEELVVVTPAPAVTPEPPAPPVTRRPAAAHPPAVRRSSPVGWLAALAAVVVIALIAYGLTTRDTDPPADGASPTTTAAGSAGSASRSPASTGGRGGAAPRRRRPAAAEPPPATGSPTPTPRPASPSPILAAGPSAPTAPSPTFATPTPVRTSGSTTSHLPARRPRAPGSSWNGASRPRTRTTSASASSPRPTAATGLQSGSSLTPREERSSTSSTSDSSPRGTASPSTSRPAPATGTACSPPSRPSRTPSKPLRNAVGLLTGYRGDGNNAAMAFGRKRKEAPQQQQSAPAAGSSSPWQTYGGGGGGYMVTELPYYDKGKRKIMVYTSDASGKIIKTFKR